MRSVVVIVDLTGLKLLGRGTWLYRGSGTGARCRSLRVVTSCSKFGVPPPRPLSASLLGEVARVLEEATGEAHVPTKQSSPGAATWISAPDADPRRARRGPGSTSERSCAPVGMIWRVRDRGTFEALRRSGRRARRGPVTVTYLPAGGGSTSTRVAFGVSRKVGNAVARNRTRRRLRSVMQGLDASPKGLRPGTYLLTTGPEVVDVGYGRLAELVAAACSESSQAPGKPAR
jgi:RNase P protein component